MTVLVSDSFNRADSTSGLGTTDSYNGGTSQTWVAQNAIGTWGIKTNQAYQPTTSTGDGLITVDAGQSDNLTIYADMPTSPSSSNTAGLIFRFQDTSNYMRAVLTSGTVYLQKWVSGTKTTISSKTATFASPNTLQITLSGSSISISLNGTPLITATDSSLNTSTNTKVGFDLSNSTTLTFDNFNVVSNIGETNATITSVIANTTASSIAPTVTTQKQVSVSSVVANANANTLVPQVGSFTNAMVNAVIANATASAINPSISTTRNISVVSPVFSANADGLIPSIVVPMSTQITAVMAYVMADAISPVILLNQSIWKSGNKPNTAWNTPIINAIPFK